MNSVFVTNYSLSLQETISFTYDKPTLGPVYNEFCYANITYGPAYNKFGYQGSFTLSDFPSGQRKNATLTGKMGMQPILPVTVSVIKIKGAARQRYVDSDVTVTLGVNWPLCCIYIGVKSEKRFHLEIGLQPILERHRFNFNVNNLHCTIAM